MAIENIFKRQKQIYLFYTLFPMLLFAEIMIFTMTGKEKQENLWLLSLGLFMFVVEVIIIVIQLVSRVRFFREINKMSETERNSFEARPLLVGPILVNDLFVIEYRMFSKKIIPISDIFQVKYAQEIAAGKAGAIRTAFSLRKIVLIREGKKQIVLKAPKLYFGQESKAIVNSINNVIKGKMIREDTKDYYSEYDGDYPFYGMFALGLTGVVLLLNRVHIPFMNLFIDTDDKIEYFLFHTGYDSFFQIGAIVLIIAYVIGSFIWKYRYIGIDFESYAINFVMPISVIGLLFLWIAFVSDYGAISSKARMDYVNYKNKNYEYADVEIVDVDNYFSRVTNAELKNMLNGLETRLYVCEDVNRTAEFLFLDGVMDIEPERKYRVTYLENTGLIVEI